MLVMPALENGFPILHSDSGYYLLVGYLDKIPVSRPITYCLFVRFSSFQYSIWSTIIIQAAITTWLILKVLKIYFPLEHVASYGFITISILSLTTGLSHYVSQIMPDIFLPLALLGFFVILLSEKISKLELFLVSLLTLLSGIMHMSNLPVLTGTLLTAALLTFIVRKSYKVFISGKSLLAIIILLLSWITIPTINYAYHDGFRFSNSSSIVFFSRLLESGAAQTYIMDKCETDTTLKICKFKDEIIQYEHFDQFLWNDDSFLYDDETCKKVAWDDCWKLRNEEFGRLNHEILGYEKSKKQFIAAVISDFFEQIGSFRLKFFTSFKEGSHIDIPIKKYFPHDRKAFLSANQYSGTLKFDYLSDIQFILVIASLLILILFLFFTHSDRNIKMKLLSLLLFSIISIFVSSFITAVFAVVSGRFTGRLIWLIPFLVIISAYKIYLEIKESGEGK